MKAGDIVVVDWRDSLRGSGEPNKLRPAIVVGGPPYFGTGLPFEIVVPLTSEADLAIPGASLPIVPTRTNGCKKLSFALSWSVQAVPHARLSITRSRVTTEQIDVIRVQIARCIGLAA